MTLLAALMLLVAACGDRSVTPPVAAATPTPAQVEEARRFRETFGLRADDAWILMVAKEESSQASVPAFGIPLLPSELTEVLERTTAYTDAGPIILDYARTVPDDWFGSYIDQERGGVIVAQFFRNTNRHRAALAQLLSKSARWEVQQVDQRTLDMIALVPRIKGDAAWFASIDAELLDAVTNPLYGGIVELTYRANSRDLDQVIMDHYGAPEWLRVERAGGLPWTGPVGDLVVKAVEAGGKPVPDIRCNLGGGDVGVSTDINGECRFTGVAAIRYRVELIRGIEGSTELAGTADVIVKPDETTTVTILAGP